ncbi:lysophospholipase [Roseococcus sp. YIM B11640]|uniref:alpha/beta hydrolase n=1 Tax=Roseococcus sp. YIM B11640 TaxID=3133973 RepID=UPI003C7A2ECB
MKLLAALFLAALSLGACAPVMIPAGPVIGEASIVPFVPPPLPWTYRPAYAFAPSPPEAQPSGPRPEEMLVMPDGARLPLRIWRPEGEPRFLVVALHGLTDHGGNFMADGGPLLTAGGAIVYAYDQRGFGWNPARGYWAGTDTLVGDAREAIRLLRRRHPGLPVYVLGESMGAAVALVLDPRDVSGVILSSPAIWGGPYLSDFLRGLLWGASRALGPLAMPAGAAGITASDNPEALRRFARDPLTLHEVRFDMVKGIVDLMDQAVAALPACCREVPTLVMIGGRDQVVPIRYARRALHDAAVPRVAFYPEGWHLLLRDRNREQVARDVLAFMANPAQRLPAEEAGREWLAATPPP